MTFDKQGRMLAALVSEESEIDEFLAKQETIELPDSRKDFYNGVVIKLMSIGVMVYLPDYNQLGFLHVSEQTHIPRLGEKISVRVSYTREDGRINLSMKQVREVSRLEDADLILNFLQERGGAMPYSDNTSPEIIKQKFKLSKAAFKRALGKLMSERVIYQQDGWTYMTDRNSTDRN
jgi:predicted RNA-binding protein (virulence factor B family)